MMPPRSAQLSSDPGVGHNGPDDGIILKFAQQAIVARTKFEEAHEVSKAEQGAYRSILKAAKKSGINQDVLVRAMDARRRDEADVVAEERTYIRYCALLNMPMRQADLFGDMPQPTVEQQVFDAADAGYQAGKTGQLIDDNPWDQAGESEMFTEWRSGWHRGQAVLARGMGRPKAGAGRRAKTNGHHEGAGASAA